MLLHGLQCAPMVKLLAAMTTRGAKLLPLEAPSCQQSGLCLQAYMPEVLMASMPSKANA